VNSIILQHGFSTAA